ncbi:MAG: response regulator [Solirubrobacterales bacterium]
MTRGPEARSDVVLVVEDDPQVLDLEIQVLTSAGYAVTGAGTVAEALAGVRGSRPDLILLDVQLGREDGLDVARHLRKDPATRDILIVASSASTSVADIERARIAGCASFLAKPLTLRGFLEGVRRCLETASSAPPPNPCDGGAETPRPR